MKQQFLDLNGLTELVTYLKKSITEQKEILPYASNKLFPSVGDINTIYIDTATNTIYRWDSSSKTYVTLAKAVKSVVISEATENGKITLTVDGNKTTVPIHGLGSAAYTNSSAYSPAGHTHTKAQVGLGNVDNTADANKSVKHAITADSATTAGTATNVSAGEGTADAARHVWFSDSATETKRAYSDKFKYNPVTNNLTVNVTGNAATASSVAWGNVTGKPSTYAPSAHNHDDSTITSLNASKLFGTIDIARLPHGALERCVIVADDTARFALTTAKIQLGDTVKVNKTQKMYFVIDDSKLNSEAGYTVYTAGSAASVPWSGVTGKPSTYTPSVHSHKMTDISDWGSYIYDVHASRTANTVLAAPNGSNGSATFRKLVAADIPSITKSKISDFPSSLPASDVYAWAKASTKPSYSWNEITGKPGTFAPASHTHNYIAAIMSSSAVPTKAADGRVEFYYNVNNGLANNMPSTNNANAIISLSRHAGDYPSQLGFSSDGNIYYREGVGTTAWKTIITSSNYTSYTTTKTGGGASGTWGINVSGIASKATLLAPAYSSSTLTTTTSTWRNGVTEGNVVWGQSWVDRSLSGDSGDLTIWIKKNGSVTTANMTIDGTITAVSGFIGSLSGNASSATALTTSAGSATHPVYFSGGKPVACTYTLAKSVPADAKFTDTNTWRGVQNNLTSDSTSDSLSAAQGKALKALVDGKAPSNHSHSYLPLSGGTMSGTATITWADSGNWGNSNKDVTFPVIRGGLSWFGQSDGIQLYAVETQNDNLELYLKFTDDNSNGLSIRNKDNTQTARISATGEITASKFVGNLSGTASAVPWSGITGKPSTFTPASHTHNYAGSSSAGGNANAAVKLATARKIGNASFDGTADITLSQMGLNVPVEITKANYLAKKKAGTLNANTYYNVIDEYDSANVINDSSVTANSAFSSTKSEKTYAKKSAIINTTLTASKWTGSSAPYTYVLPVSGATTSNIVEINYASNASSQAIEAYQNAMLADGGQTTNQITIKATEKPTVDIPITIVIRNDL